MLQLVGVTLGFSSFFKYPSPNGLAAGASVPFPPPPPPPPESTKACFACTL